MSEQQRPRGTGSIRARGQNSWEIKWKIDDPKTGKRRDCTETVRGTRTEANKVLRARIAAADRGEGIAPSKVTIEQWIKGRIERWHGLGKIRQKTVEQRTGSLDRWIAPHIGKIPIQKLTAQHVEQLHATLLSSGRTYEKDKGGLSARSCQIAHGLLVQALNDAVKHNLVPRNVASIQGGPRRKTNKVEILKVDKANGVDEIDALLTGLDGHAFYDVALTTLYTGLRRGELLALTWKHVKLDQKLLEVRFALEETRAHGVAVKETKTESGLRDVTLPHKVVDVLRDRRTRQRLEHLAAGLGKMPDDALVFPAPEGGYHRPTHFSQRWHRAVRKLKVPIATWHALRHTHASMLIDQDVNIVKISKRLGHKSPDITLKVYAHLFKTDDRDVADAIDRMLVGA